MKITYAERFGTQPLNSVAAFILKWNYNNGRKRKYALTAVSAAADQLERV